MNGLRVAFGMTAWLLFSAAAHANLLVNPGFETGDFNGWTVGGTSANVGVGTAGTLIPGADPTYFSNDVVNVNSGSYAAYADVSCGVTGCDPEQVITLEQVISVAPDQTITAGFSLSEDSNYPSIGVRFGDQYTQIFINGVGILPATSMGAPYGAAYSQVMGSAAIGDTTTLDVVFRITGSGTSAAGISLDDFVVDGIAGPPADSDVGSALPEPGGWIPLLALAGLAGIFRKRALAGRA